MVDLNGKSVLVTGGTGSFGKAFVKAILDRYRVRRLVIFSRDELKQFEMAQAREFIGRPELRFFIGDVRDMERLKTAMRDVDFVVHAAALKHVSIAEYNPFECVRTNIIGAENVVKASMGSSVQRVIALSTDKACNPINLYGASKLASDKIFIAANNYSGGDGPRFAVVRYGNVVGSRGSVVPFFRNLVRQGATEIPITDPRMTRFWITLPQGVDFVLSSLKVMKGGEVFVPKIPSMRVTDLAEVVAPGLPHRIVGIRPGEKLHEMMISADDSRNTLELADRYIICPNFSFWRADNYEVDGARRLEDGFSYTSDTNPDWLDAGGLERLLQEVSPDQ